VAEALASDAALRWDRRVVSNSIEPAGNQ
jgi:hypothetical protein